MDSLTAVLGISLTCRRRRDRRRGRRCHRHRHRRHHTISGGQYWYSSARCR